MPAEHEALRAVAARLAGAPLLALDRVGAGRNSRVYHVRTAAAEFALKSYPHAGGDARDRLGTEFGALRFLHGHAAVPQAIAAAPEAGCALYAWIPGNSASGHGPGDLDALVELLAATHRMRTHPAAGALPLASEACLSLAAIRQQLVLRRQRLADVGEAALGAFFRDFDRAAAALVADAERAAGDAPPELPLAQRTLSPSDVGFHNALRLADGSLVFLDFEYFGWDDPVKPAADVLWHPAMELSDAERAHFRAAAGRLYGADPEFAARFASRYPLFGLRWALIVLNEYLDPVWERRVRSGETRPRAAVLAAQLEKAAGLLARARAAACEGA